MFFSSSDVIANDFIDEEKAVVLCFLNYHLLLRLDNLTIGNSKLGSLSKYLKALTMIPFLGPLGNYLHHTMQYALLFLGI